MNNKYVVITGAASGIGRALAQQYVKKDFTVIALDRDQGKLEECATVLGKKYISEVCDVTHSDELWRLANSYNQKLGAPEIWINNAGSTVLGKFEDLSADDFNRVWNICFMGVVNGTRTALTIMKNPERGSIVNVASVNGKVPAPFMSAYVAAKHAVVGFTQSLQLEKSQTGSALKIILVNPGFVKTQIMSAQNGFQFPEWLQWTVESPERTARQIIKGIQAGDSEINPTLNGKMIQKAYWFSPKWVGMSTRLLTAKTLTEALGLKSIRK